MAAPTSGRFPKNDPDHPNWRWQVYADPASKSGYTRKIIDPGTGTEYFENYDYAADQEDADAQESASTVRASQSSSDRDAQARERDKAYEQHNDELDRDYNNKRDDRRSKEQTAKDDREERLQEIQDKLKEDRYQFDKTYGLDRDKLGLERDKVGADLLKTESTLRGSENVFQGFQYANGVANNSDLAGYVRSVYGSTYGAKYGGGTATNGSPTPLTVGSLAKSLTGESGSSSSSGNTMSASGTDSGGSQGSATTSANGGGGTGYDQYGRANLTAEQQSYLQPIKEAYEGGLANKGLGYIENMSGNQLKAFKSGGDYIGRDTDSDITYYQRSRPGQRSALAA